MRLGKFLGGLLEFVDEIGDIGESIVKGDIDELIEDIGELADAVDDMIDSNE